MSSIHNFIGNDFLNHTEKFAIRDTFGRLRVSNPATLFEFSHINNNVNNIDFSDYLINGATIVHSTDSYMSLKTSTTNGSKAVQQTRQYIPYQPGKSKLILLTGVLEESGGITGIRTRIGVFDDHNDKNHTLDAGGNGLFFELDGKTLYVVERKSSNGTGQIDIRIPQNEWNIDTFGAGALNPSKKIISQFNKTKIFVIDLEWLGVGFSRFGFILDGKIHYCHIFKHKKLTKPYMRTAKLPIRYEIENVSSSTEGILRKICGTVISEGGYNLKGKTFSDGTNSNYVAVPDTKYVPILTLKLKQDIIRNTIYLKNIDLLISATTNKPIHYDIRYNPSDISGISYRDVNDASCAQISVTGTGVTGGIVLNSGYVSTKGSQTLIANVDDLLNNIPIAADITGTSDIVTLVAIGIGGAADVYAQFNWLEIN